MKDTHGGAKTPHAGVDEDPRPRADKVQRRLWLVLLLLFRLGWDVCADYTGVLPHPGGGTSRQAGDLL
jgi:hypothetical protein